MIANLITGPRIVSKQRKIVQVADIRRAQDRVEQAIRSRRGCYCRNSGELQMKRRDRVLEAGEPVWRANAGADVPARRGIHNAVAWAVVAIAVGNVVVVDGAEIAIDRTEFCR